MTAIVNERWLVYEGERVQPGQANSCVPLLPRRYALVQVRDPLQGNFGSDDGLKHRPRPLEQFAKDPTCQRPDLVQPPFIFARSEPVKLGMNDLISTSIQRLDAHLNTLWKKLVIGVQEAYPCALGGSDAGVPRRLGPCSPLPGDQAYSWIAPRPGADPRHSVITGRVVYDDDLDIGIRLDEHTVD